MNDENKQEDDDQNNNAEKINDQDNEMINENGIGSPKMNEKNEENLNVDSEMLERDNKIQFGDEDSVIKIENNAMSRISVIIFLDKFNIIFFFFLNIKNVNLNIKKK